MYLTLKLQLNRNNESFLFSLNDQNWEISRRAFQQLCMGIKDFEQSPHTNEEISKTIYLELANNNEE